LDDQHAAPPFGEAAILEAAPRRCPATSC
jgi:hypothetical protein